MNSSAEVTGNSLQDELEPWIITDDSTGTVCLWHIAKLETQALALFSTPELAAQYAASLPTAGQQIRQLKQMEMLKLFLQSYQSKILHAVLDPNAETARQLFPLKDILQAARQQLRDQAAGDT